MKRSGSPRKSLGWPFCLEIMQLCRIPEVEEITKGKSRWKSLWRKELLGNISGHFKVLQAGRGFVWGTGL